MGKASRDKGRRGQQEAQALLRDRDWNPVEINGGTAVEDFIAFDPLGQSWAVEVKNTVSITTAHRQQAMEQAAKRKLPWMLISKIAGTSSWLVQMKGRKPVVWSGKDD
jgi:hypothetical protein